MADAATIAAVREALNEILLEGGQYSALPLVDPATKLLPPPTVDAIREPLEEAVTDLDETAAAQALAIADAAGRATVLEQLTADGRLSEDALSTTIAGEVETGIATVQPRVRARAAVQRGNRSRAVKQSLPAGLGWAAPINIFKAGRRYLTDFDVSAFRNTGGSTIYVHHVTGSDANNGSTEVLAVKTLLRAYQLAASGDTIEILSTGAIFRPESWSAQRLRKSLNIIARNPGEVVIPYADSLSYSLAAAQTYTYQATRSNVLAVVDIGVTPEGFGYTLRASIAEVEANPGSWYLNGSTLYVHALNGLTPDQTRVFAILAGEHFYAESDTAAVSLYLEGIRIIGGNTGNLMVNAATHDIDIYAKGCSFAWSTGAGWNSVNVFGARYAFFQDCVAACSRKDGYNYTAYNVAGALMDAPRFIEVDCVGFAHGINTPSIAGVNNVTTAHAGAKGVRVGGTYYDSDGTPVADVQTDTRTANYSCTAYGSTAVTAVYNAAWAAQQAGVEMWLYDCQGFDAATGLYVVTGATLHADASEFDSQNGGGTFDITNAV